MILTDTPTRKRVILCIAVFITFSIITRLSYAQEKITGPWLWMIAPTQPGQGGAAATDIDSIAEASGGQVTEEIVAQNGAREGERVRDKAWTPGEISPTGGNNVNDIVTEIGLGTGDINDHSSYAFLIIESSTDQNGVDMKVGSDDSVKVWLNGEVVHTNAVNRGASDFQDTFQVDLKQGQNLLLVKIGERGTNWSMFVGIEAEFTTSLDLIRNEVMPQQIFPRTVGDSFSIDLEASISEPLHSFAFDLTFDPTVLRAISVDSTPFLGSDGQPITCETPQIDNATGRIAGVSCQRDGAGGISGEGVLAQITFEAIGIGESALRIENTNFSAPDGTAIEFSTREGAVTVFGPHSTITGRVIDFEGNPVNGVEVSALKGDLSVGIVGQTDSDGNYVIENITEAGSVTVRAINPGLISGVVENVAVQISQTTANIDLILPEPTALHSVVDSEGFIRNWMLLGPIPWENDGNRLISDQFSVTDPDLLLPPQEQETRELLPSEGEYGSGLAKTRRWILHVDSDGDIDFASLYGQIKGVGYAFTSVKSPLEQEATLQLGSGDGIAVWLNGKLVHLNNVGRGREIDQDAVPKLTLQKGWNSLLIKVENQNGDWGFLARFAGRKSLLADLEPITDLEISPQWPTVDSGLTQGTFNLALLKGLNMISLPVRPDMPLTAQALIDKLSATVLTKLDATRQIFVPYLPGISKDFAIEGGAGYIVNLTEAKTVAFTGSVWDNVNAASNSSGGESTVWAFVIGGKLRSDDLSRSEKITVRNLRTGQVVVGEIRRAAQDDQGRYTVAFADLSRQSIVEVGDRLEIRIDGSIPYVVTDGDLRRAFARIDIDPSALLPKQTILLQNYPNPFNPETWMPYQLSEGGEVGITIYDVRGTVIRRLDLGHKPSGYYHNRGRAAYWDGRSTFGESVASGIYFYQLIAGDFTSTRRMVIIK